jgi:hypothetical protein
MKNSNFKQLVKGAFTREELEFLMQDPAFRRAYESSDEQIENFEKLCQQGNCLLADVDFWWKASRPSSRNYQ